MCFVIPVYSISASFENIGCLFSLEPGTKWPETPPHHIITLFSLLYSLDSAKNIPLLLTVHSWMLCYASVHSAIVPVGTKLKEELILSSLQMFSSIFFCYNSLLKLLNLFYIYIYIKLHIIGILNGWILHCKTYKKCIVFFVKQLLAYRFNRLKRLSSFFLMSWTIFWICLEYKWTVRLHVEIDIVCISKAQPRHTSLHYSVR